MSTLDDALGLDPIPPKRTEPHVPVAVTNDEDFELARKNIHRVMTKVEDTLDELAEVARSSENPRAYEVYAAMAKVLVDANKDLMNIREIRRRATPEEQRQPSVPQGGGGGEVLLISSTDLLRHVKESIRKSKVDVIDAEVVEPKVSG